jgi:two-component system sensor histidine kinase QseC
VATSDLPLELRPIAEQLNSMLDRLQAAFQRERRFTANVAHELATPVSELRALAENASKWHEDPEATAQFATDVQDVAIQMQRVLETLQSLARCESGLQLVRNEPVELVPLIEKVLDSLAERFREKQLMWSCDLAPLVVETDRSLCRTILQNLWNNAIEYTPPAGRIRCRLERKADGVNLILGNATGGLAEDDVPHLFEPFWRQDAARADRAHVGLGLALVKALAEVLALDVRLELARPDWIEVTLHWRTRRAGTP